MKCNDGLKGNLWVLLHQSNSKTQLNKVDGGTPSSVMHTFFQIKETNAHEVVPEINWKSEESIF